MIASAPEDTVAALNTYGDALGISFQIVDDLLDYGGVSQSLGKNIGDDFRERKLTLPVIKAIAKASSEERKFWDRVIAKGDQKDGDLEHAMTLLQTHGTLQETRDAAIYWGNRAKSALEALPDSKIRDLLGDLTDFVVSRAV